MKQPKYIVVAGGVISGVGKGVATASIGKIMQIHGYQTTLIKIDPYINVDAGTLRPTEHGEVWVTKEGGEIDQDLGTYERFMGIDLPKKNNITTGQLYQTIIERERKGEYLGQTVQFVPHLTQEIIDRIKSAAQESEIAVIEIGGTVGDYENIPFLEAFKTLERELPSRSIIYVLVTYLPVPAHINEIKTKPTQQAIRMLGQQGIIPDIIICRSHVQLDADRREKIERAAKIAPEYIIAAPDLEHVYQMPLLLEEQQLGNKLLKLLEIKKSTQVNWSAWKMQIAKLKNPTSKVPIAIVGKYTDYGNFSMPDSYISIYHALMHATAHLDIAAEVSWLDAVVFENEGMDILKNFAGIIVPGGFGPRGVEGKIKAIAYARIHTIPFLGICYGFQLAAVEYARSVCKLQGANTTEVDSKTAHPIIDLLPLQKEFLSAQQMGGTMRLGDYKAHMVNSSKIAELYKKFSKPENVPDRNEDLFIYERHRHRYEVNPDYVDILQKAGFLFSGYHQREDGRRLMEFGELSNHPFFVGTQAHPEFKSRFENAHPLFLGLMQAADAYFTRNNMIEAPVFTHKISHLSI